MSILFDLVEVAAGGVYFTHEQAPTGSAVTITSINAGADITTGDSGVVILGSNFEAAQGVGGVTQSGEGVTETAWANTSVTITTLTVESSSVKYGASSFTLTNDSIGSDSIDADVLPLSGNSFTDLTSVAATGDRITSVDDLVVGDQIRYETLLYDSGDLVTAYTVTVNDDATFTLGNGPITNGRYHFEVNAWDSVAPGWGTAVDQQIIVIGEMTSGDYSYTGNNASIAREIIESGDSGLYSYSGTDVVAGKTILLGLDTDSYSYTGTIVDLGSNPFFEATSGTYSYTGTDAIIYLSDVFVSVDVGVYSYTGQNLILRVPALYFDLQGLIDDSSTDLNSRISTGIDLVSTIN